MADFYKSFSSEEFVICCGSVFLDKTRNKVFLLKNNKTQEIVLPKGRKNIDESLVEASIRETFEETGYKCKLLPLEVKVRATLPAQTEDIGHYTKNCKEPIHVTIRGLESKRPKIIFWFITELLDYAKRAEKTNASNEDFDLLQVNLEESVSFLSFESDKDVIRETLKILKFNKKN